MYLLIYNLQYFCMTLSRFIFEKNLKSRKKCLSETQIKRYFLIFRFKSFTIWLLFGSISNLAKSLLKFEMIFWFKQMRAIFQRIYSNMWKSLILIVMKISPKIHPEKKNFTFSLTIQHQSKITQSQKSDEFSPSTNQYSKHFTRLTWK